MLGSQPEVLLGDNGSLRVWGLVGQACVHVTDVWGACLFPVCRLFLHSAPTVPTSATPTQTRKQWGQLVVDRKL